MPFAAGTWTMSPDLAVLAVGPDPPLAGTRRIGRRLLASAAAQLQAARSNLSTEGEAVHAGIHEARKCIRRARASLALGGRVFGPPAARLDDELARLCRGLSALRDAQALVEELQRLAASAPAALREILPLAEAAARQRRDDRLQHALTRDPGFRSRLARLLAAQARLARLDWQAIGDADVAEAVGRSKRRAGKARRRAERHMEDNHLWHVYRRRLRRLRQQDTLLAEFLPALRPATHDLHDHKALGEAQDDALLLRRCGKGSPFPPGQRALLRKIARERLQRARDG